MDTGVVVDLAGLRDPTRWHCSTGSTPPASTWW
jgi:hypothetical protein